MEKLQCGRFKFNLVLQAPEKRALQREAFGSVNCGQRFQLRCGAFPEARAAGAPARWSPRGSLFRGCCPVERAWLFPSGRAARRARGRAGGQGRGAPKSKAAPGPGPPPSALFFPAVPAPQASGDLGKGARAQQVLGFSRPGGSGAMHAPAVRGTGQTPPAPPLRVGAHVRSAVAPPPPPAPPARFRSRPAGTYSEQRISGERRWRRGPGRPPGR